MKTYSVWIEVEEYDDKTDKYRDCDGLGGAAVLTVKSENKAFDFAERLQSMGEALAQQERKQNEVRRQRRAEKTAH